VSSSFSFTKEKNEPNKALAAAIFDNPLGLVLTPQTGESAPTRKFPNSSSEFVRAEMSNLARTTRLGVCREGARKFRPGFYKLAEQCARVHRKRNPQSQEAMLLRAHVLQNLHRFKESETLARRLVQQRGLSFDYGFWAMR
jgi:hypothetical protein